MNRWKIGCIVLAVLVVAVGVGGFFYSEHRYNTGYQAGDIAGFQRGTAELEAKVKEARQEGYEAYADPDNPGPELKEAWDEIEGLQAQLAKYPQLQLRDPKFTEAIAFLEEDNTDEEVPTDFALSAILTIENAQKKGIRAYWVVAQLAEGFGFSFIGFNTTDLGWRYFVATADSSVRLDVGRRYWNLNGGILNQDYDDTIVSLHYLPTP